MQSRKVPGLARSYALLVFEMTRYQLYLFIYLFLECVWISV